jgi:hypothetical protein
MWRERCGGSGVAAAADGSSWAEPAGDDQSGGRACVRAGAQTWRAHLRGRQRGRSERASGRWRTFFEFTENFYTELYTRGVADGEHAHRHRYVAPGYKPTTRVLDCTRLSKTTPATRPWRRSSRN